MKAPNRDLLVLVKHARDNEEAMEQELTQLHSLLLDVENPRTFSNVFEVIDCNRFKVYTDSKHIMHAISAGESAFVFLNNKN
ncbi:hypothetical protein [Flavihumibacter solisilvae]|jgi:hypothetical protein|uniref:Uncharacterized protein n=1 Tax=Flavihumibacter solisilvae TaxID=1349421 RepID=A0A0C1L9V5_9BACT|nr:hypothetical protein [Flavihumibacter solisilvae]KIC96311.1 hypothetical protein OI18_00680 [Flavihumibacter solisilvae]